MGCSVSRRGSVTVYIMIILTALCSMLGIFISSAQQKAVYAGTESLGRLWASSIIAEYDRDLLERFGIFAYLGDPHTVDLKLDSYCEKTFAGKSYIKWEGCSSDIYPFSLANVSIFKNQISKAGAEAVIGGERSLTETYGEENVSDREIINERLTGSLPSAGRTDNGLLERVKNLIKGLGSITDIVEQGSDIWLTGKYIDSHFDSMTRQSAEDDSYLRYEKEYLICGNFSDAANYRGTRNRIVALREVMNIAFIEADEEMYFLTFAAAEAIATPALAPVAQQGIIAAWALAESVNDYKLLINGKRVPLVKDRSSWATDLDSVMNNTSDLYIDPGTDGGDTYDEYLSTLIYLMDSEIKYLRMMDLIQMDMIYCSNGGFRIGDCYTGVSYTLEVNGEKHEFSDEYQKS